MKRVVLTGSESVGKSVLAQRLAAHYGVLAIPEFAREYAAWKGTPLVFSDHEPIAHGQMALEDEYRAAAQAAGHPLLLYDTDVISTLVYCHHYYSRSPTLLDELARMRRADLYLLLDIDVPWVADGVRDRGDRREEVHAHFLQTLTRLDMSVTLIQGSWDDRFASAVHHIDALLRRS